MRAELFQWEDVFKRFDNLLLKDETTRRSAKGAPQKISADFLRGPQAFTGGAAAA